MHRGLHGSLIGTVAALSLGGCMQMTRHSNTLVFGTNTSFGVTVGADATSTPSISVGFKRQEAVVMPLVANVKEENGIQVPCVVGPANVRQAGLVEGDGTAALVSAHTHPCLLVGRDESGSLDAYSVLASFGTKYDARTGGVGGSIAQYFATGVAAQRLASSGGAAVATGEAARTSADPANARLRTALEEANAGELARAATRKSIVDELAVAVAALAPAALDAKITAVDARFGTRLKPACPDLAQCEAQVRAQGGGLRGLLPDSLQAVTTLIKEK